MCFDVGESADSGKEPPAELVLLPYPVCWIEGAAVNVDGRSVMMGWLCVRGPDNDPSKFEFFGWGREQGEWTCLGWWRFDGSYPGLFSSELQQQYDDGNLQSVAVLLSLALSLLNCSNIVTRRHDPDPKLQKARAKRGKQPLFSYHTLEIDPQASREAGIDQGGTHASPRVHLRRGHIRKFAPGKWCWVRETIVRGITPGMVHKDYALKGAVH